MSTEGTLRTAKAVLSAIDHALDQAVDGQSAALSRDHLEWLRVFVAEIAAWKTRAESGAAGRGDEAKLAGQSGAEDDTPRDAELKAARAAHDEWVAAGRPGALTHEEVVAELLREDAEDTAAVLEWKARDAAGQTSYAPADEARRRLGHDALVAEIATVGAALKRINPVEDQIRYNRLYGYLIGLERQRRALADAPMIRELLGMAARLTVIHAVLSAGTAGPEYRRAFEDGSPGVPD